MDLKYSLFLILNCVVIGSKDAKIVGRADQDVFVAPLVRLRQTTATLLKRKAKGLADELFSLSEK